MFLPIYVYGNSVLKKVAKPIDKDYPDLEKLIENMFDTMTKSDGIGLAAPQIGKSIRLFVIDATPLAEDNPELSDFRKIFINAKITKYEGEEWTYNEGCLSVPDMHEDIDRPEKITIEYLDENFEAHTETFDGISARIIQHEYDHIEGKLFIEKVSPIRKRMLGRKLTALTKGKFRQKYKVVLPKK